MDEYLKIVGLCLLAAPLVWEITNDKDGDAHLTRGLFKPYRILSKRLDIATRISIATAAGMFNWYFNGVNFFKSVFLSGALHFFLFDYIIAFVLIARGVVVGHWFTYLGSKGMDNVYHWKTMDPVGRLIVRALVFALALAIYFYEPRRF